MGIPVARTSTVVWGIAAAFTAVTIIVLASVQFVTPLGAANGTAQLTLGYPVLVKALLIAMIARMRILWLTIPVGIALGIVEVIFQQNVTGIDANVFALWLFVATLVVVLTLPRSMRVVTETGNTWKLAGRVKPLPERLRDIWLMRQLPRLGVVAALLVFAVIPAFAPQASQSFLWTKVVIFAIAGCSLTILSGWAGQLSLGQFGFSAIGGLVTVKMVTSGWFGVHNVPWGVAVTLGVLVGAGAAVLIGIPALRIPGLYLAVTTLAFAVFVENWLVTRRWLGIDELTGSIPVLQRPDTGIVNFSSRHSYYYLCLFFLAVCLAVLAQIRRSGIGRSIIAVRDNERSAETMTVSTTPREADRVRDLRRHRRARRCALRHVAPHEHAEHDVRDLGVGRAGRHRRHRRARLDRRPVARRGAGSSGCPRCFPTSPPRRYSSRPSVCWRSSSTSPAASPRSPTACATRSSNVWHDGSRPRRRASVPTTLPSPCPRCSPRATVPSPALPTGWWPTT